MIMQSNNTIPKWIFNRAIQFYFLVLAVASFLFYSHHLDIGWIIIGTFEVLVFFGYGSKLIQDWREERMRSAKAFERKLFRYGLLFRLFAVMAIYYGFMLYYDDAFGFENADAKYYEDVGLELANALRSGGFVEGWNTYYQTTDLSDMGYFTYLSFIYYIFEGSYAVLVPRFINCLVSAYTVILIYRTAKRNFGEQVGRIAAIFVMLWPNFWFYCGTQLKEPWMVFLFVLYAEQSDQMLRSRQFTAWKIVPLILLVGGMLTLRTPLALVMILSLLFAVVMSSSRVVGWGKRVIVGILTVALLVVTMGNRMEEQARELMNQASSGQQEQNMEWRTKRDNGNAFAKYATRSVFAPLIFTIPFPTVVETPKQYDLKIVNGGNFCKNIMSGFTIFALFVLFLSGDWRKHLIPLALVSGYLVVLALSTFAQSERFHQPAVPFEMMFAAYGIVYIIYHRKRKKFLQWASLWYMGIVVICVAWQWFKLAGRGMA